MGESVRGGGLEATEEDLMLPSLSPVSLSKSIDPRRDCACPVKLLRAAARWDRGVGHSLGLLDLVESTAIDIRRLSGSSLI